MEKKQEVIELLGKTTLAILNEEIPQMISLCQKIGLSSRIGSPLLDLCKQMIVDKLSTHLLNSSAKSLIIKRKGNYGEYENDYYTLENGVLQRNKKPATWSSVSKLYQAYMAVVEKTYVED